MYHETKYLNNESLEMWNSIEKRYRTERTRQVCWNSLVFLCEYAQKDMLEITPIDMKKFYEVQKQKEVNTQEQSIDTATRLASLNTIYEWYGKNIDQTHKNPCSIVSSVIRTSELLPTEYPSKKELEKIEERIKTDRQYYFIYLITEFTGAKGRDILLLKHSSFSMTEEGMTVTLGVGSKKKTLLLPREKESYLRDYLKSREYLPNLFDNMWGKMLTQRTMERTLEMLCGQTALSFGTLRTALIANHIAECENPKKYMDNLFIERKQLKKYIELSKYYTEEMSMDFVS